MSQLTENNARARLSLKAPRGLSAASVRASLSYLKPTDQRPCNYTYSPPAGVPWESCEYESRAVRIHDARVATVGPSLTCEGFELRDAPTALRNFENSHVIEHVYYPEVAELALAITGATKAYVFDHLVRKCEPAGAPLAFSKRGSDGFSVANGRIHGDYTEASGRKRLALVLKDADLMMSIKRFSIVNIWRSIGGPVLDTPLAVCDARTVRPDDLVSSDVHYPERSGEIYLATYSRAHRWSYFPTMERHEALVFKQFDSLLSGVSRFTPHAAFNHPDAPVDAPPRTSIETRCLVTY